MKRSKGFVSFLLSFFIVLGCKDPAVATNKPASQRQLESANPISDPVFKQRLIEEYGIEFNRQDCIEPHEAAKVDKLVLHYDADSNYGSIQDFSGIEQFKNLTHFDAYGQKELLKPLDLSLNKNLNYVRLTNAHGPELILGDLPYLQTLDLLAADFAALEHGYCPKLSYLNIQYTYGLLSRINFAQFPFLWSIYIDGADDDVEAINVASNDELYWFRLHKNKKNKGLQTIYVSHEQKRKLKNGLLPSWNNIEDINYKISPN